MTVITAPSCGCRDYRTFNVKMGPGVRQDDGHHCTFMLIGRAAGHFSGAGAAPHAADTVSAKHVPAIMRDACMVSSSISCSAYCDTSIRRSPPSNRNV
jgi:hypothetical protein